MTLNQLYDEGVERKHIKSFMQMRKVHTHPVTTLQLDFEGFGQSLRTLREDADISLREMAKKLKLSPPFLSDCELGRRKLSISHSILYIKHCNV